MSLDLAVISQTGHQKHRHKTKSKLIICSLLRGSICRVSNYNTKAIYKMGRLFANHILNRGLVPDIHKEYPQLSTKKIKNNQPNKQAKPRQPDLLRTKDRENKGGSKLEISLLVVRMSIAKEAEQKRELFDTSQGMNPAALPRVNALPWRNI